MLQSQGDIMIELKDRSQWKDAKDQKELTGKITKAMDELPGFSTDYTQPIKSRMDEMIYGQGQTSDFGVKVFGPDLNVVRQQAQQIADVVQSVKGAQDVKVQTTTGLPQLVIAINRDAIARYGINLSDVNDVIDSAIGSRTATMVVDGNQQIEVTVRLADAVPADPAGDRARPGPRPERAASPAVDEVATHSGAWTARCEIDRENEKRRIMVNANVGGSDLGSFVKDVKQKITVSGPPAARLLAGLRRRVQSLQAGRSRLTVVDPHRPGGDPGAAADRLRARCGRR